MASRKMDRTVSWPLLPDQFTMTTLFKTREKKMQKPNDLCRFHKAKPEGHIHLIAL